MNIDKLRLFGDNIEFTSDNICVVKEKFLKYRVFTEDEQGTVYDDYFKIAEELIAMTKVVTSNTGMVCTEWHLYYKGVKIFCGNKTNAWLKIKSMLNKLTITEQKFSSKSKHYMYKKKINDNFYKLYVKFDIYKHHRQFICIIGKHNDYICSAEDGFINRYLFTSKYVVAINYKNLNNLEYMYYEMYDNLGRINNDIINKANELYGANGIVIFNADGDIVYATNRKINTCGELLIEDDSQLFRLDNCKKYIIETVDKRNKTIRCLYGRMYIVRDKGVYTYSGYENAKVVDTETNEEWNNVKVIKRTQELGQIILVGEDTTTSINIENYDKTITNKVLNS